MHLIRGGGGEWKNWVEWSALALKHSWVYDIRLSPASHLRNTNTNWCMALILYRCSTGSHAQVLSESPRGRSGEIRWEDSGKKEIDCYFGFLGCKYWFHKFLKCAGIQLICNTMCVLQAAKPTESVFPDLLSSLSITFRLFPPQTFCLYFKLTPLQPEAQTSPTNNLFDNVISLLGGFCSPHTFPRQTP